VGLHKLNIREIEEKMNWDYENNAVLNRRIITIIIQSINKDYQNGQGGFTDDILIHTSLIEYVTDSSSYIMNVITNDGLIGNLMGHCVYLDDFLEEDEYFIGNKKQLQIFKRKDKITKILNR